MSCRAIPLVLALAACGEPWVFVGEDLDGAILHVRQDEDGSVWAVGADGGDGPTVLRLAGGEWERLSTGDRGHLWWHWADDDTVWFVGNGGRVVRHDRAAGTFETTVLDAEATFFGVWGVPGGPMWVVGGDLFGETGPDLWRLDGTTWSEVALPDGAPTVRVLYKVWGNDADDVWVVGTSGLVLHGGATGFEVVPSPVTTALITVHGRGDDVLAVGGEVNGALLEYDGAAWSDATPPQAPQLSGAFVHAECDAMVVGAVGSVYRRSEGDWVLDEDLVLDLGFHAALVDEACGSWAGGGNLTSANLDRGVLVYRGPDDIPPIE